MPQKPLPPRPDYDEMIATLERLAEMLRKDLNHHMAERLSAIAAEMKRDAELRRNPHGSSEEDGA